MSDNDTLQRFLFEHTPIRGEIVHLDATWRENLSKHEYPAPVRELLGQMMAAAALLAGSLKLNGRMIMQLQGSGPITLMVVENNNAQELRSLAHWQNLPQQNDLKSLVGDALLTITLEPRDDQDRYQSIVEISGESLSDALMNYLQQSEQLETYLWLSADEHRAAGMMLQKLPSNEEQSDPDTWNRIIHLASTLSQEELLKVEELHLLHRLFHDETVRVFEPQPLFFRCSCSRERVSNMLRNLGVEEVNSIIAEQGYVHVACEFCNQKYNFDKIDVEALFTSSSPISSSQTRH